MSSKGPRRPAGQSGPAQSSQALEAFASSHVDPEKSSAALASFLRGAHVEHSSAIDDGTNMEGRIRMRLQLLQKTNETTKLKALQDLVQCCGSAACADEHVVQFLPNFMEMVRVHAEHPSIPIRTAAFQLFLAAIGDRLGKSTDVKAALARQLAVIVGPWVMAMHDTELAVRDAALRCFEKAFTEEKRPLVLCKSLKDILAYAKLQLESLTGPPTDEEGVSNAVQGCVRALCFVLSTCPDTKPDVLAWLDSLAHIIARLAPTKPAARDTAPATTDDGAGKKKAKKSSPKEKQSYSEKSVAIRAAMLQLYTTLVTVGATLDADSGFHAQISTACAGCIPRPHEVELTRVWELLLQWCRVHGATAIALFPPRFIDDVIDVVLQCEVPTALAIHLHSMLPFAAIVSKIAPALPIVDEFCGALVEKVKLLNHTPNVSAKEMADAWAALCECWELQHLRRVGTPDAADTLELFAVMLCTLVQTIQTPNKYARYYAPVMRLVGGALVKASGRQQQQQQQQQQHGLFVDCLDVLGGTSTTFSAVDPNSPHVEAEEELLLCIAAGVGAVAVAATSAPGASASPLAPAASEFLNRMLERLQATSDVRSAGRQGQDAAHPQQHPNAHDPRSAFTAVFAIAPQFVPAAPVREVAAQRLLRAATHRPADGTSSSSEQETTAPRDLEALLVVALQWRCAEIDAVVQKLLSSASGASPPQWLTPLLLDHRCDDVATVTSLVSSSLRAGALSDVVSLTARILQGKMAVDAEGLRAAVLGAARSLMPQHLLSSDAAAAGHATSAAKADRDDEDNEGDEEQSDGSDADGSDSDAAEPSSTDNDGLNVAERLVSIAKILSRDDVAGQLLALDRRAMLELLRLLYVACVSLAPRLHVEQHVSVKYMRRIVESLESSDDDGCDADDEDAAEKPAGDPLLQAIEAKARWVSQDLLDVCHAALAELVASPVCSQLLSPSDIEAVGVDAFMTYFLQEEAAEDAAGSQDRQVGGGRPMLACAKLSHVLIPSIVSSSRLVELLTRQRAWDACLVGIDPAAAPLQRAEDEDFALRPHVSLLVVSPARAVKTSLLVLALADFIESAPRGVAVADDLPHAILANLVLVMHHSAAFAAKVTHAATQIVARALVERTTCVENAVVSLSLLSEAHYPTLCSLLADLCQRQSKSGSSTRRVHVGAKAFATAIGQAVVHKHCKVSNASLTAAFRFLDDVNVALDCDPLVDLRDPNGLFAILAQPSQHPTDVLCNALVVLRHVSAKPAVPDGTAQGLVAFCARLLSIRMATDGARILAELAYSRVISPSIYSELVRVLHSLLCSAYGMHQLPASGKFTAAASPMSVRALGQSVRIAATVREGIAQHNRADDAMRHACNTVVFDAVCECIARLRTTSDADVQSLVAVAAFASHAFMRSLKPTDAGPLRASEAAVRVIAQTLVLLHAFLSAIPVAKYDLIGVANLAALMTAVNYLAQITLVGSNLGDLLSGIVKIGQLKMPLKARRDVYSTVGAERLGAFRRTQQSIGKTTKQRMSLFTWLTCWAVAATAKMATTPSTAAAPSPSAAAAAEGTVVSRNETFALLDIIAALALCPTAPGSKRLEDTFWWCCGDTDDATAAVEALGFDLPALSRVVETGSPALSFDTNESLARAALSVLSLLLQQPRLTAFVRDWSDTIDKRLKAQIQIFVRQTISPVLIQTALGSVLSHSPDGENSFAVSESLTVTVSRLQKFVDVGFTKDDTTVSIRIVLPESFPLHSAMVVPENTKGGAQGVAGEKWRSWLLKMTMMLLNGSHGLWDCISLFGDNLEKHFEGVEPCPICYGVVSSVNNKLPEMKCSVCRNSSFHSSCLHTWWANSGQTSCPMCRSPWIS